MSIVHNALKEELLQAIETASKYEEKIASAKTDYKKAYYTKKLNQKTEQINNMLEGLNRLIQKDKP